MERMRPTTFLNNLSISRKIWGTILVLLLGLSGGAAFIQHRIVSGMGQTLDDLRRHEALIQNATAWKGMSETNTQHQLAVALAVCSALRGEPIGPPGWQGSNSCCFSRGSPSRCRSRRCRGVAG